MAILANREHFLTVLMLYLFMLLIFYICMYIYVHTIVLLTSEGPREAKGGVSY